MIRRPVRDVLLVVPRCACNARDSDGRCWPFRLQAAERALRAAGFTTATCSCPGSADELADFAASIRRGQPDVVATIACEASLPLSAAVPRVARRENPSAVVVVGEVDRIGAASDLLGDPSVDYVVRDEGEASLPELLTARNTSGSAAYVRGISYRVAADIHHTPGRADRRVDGESRSRRACVASV